jgi:hypothetical protein
MPIGYPLYHTHSSTPTHLYTHFTHTHSVSNTHTHTLYLLTLHLYILSNHIIHIIKYTHLHMTSTVLFDNSTVQYSTVDDASNALQHIHYLKHLHIRTHGPPTHKAMRGATAYDLDVQLFISATAIHTRKHRIPSDLRS